MCDPEALRTALRVLHRALHCRFPAGDTNRGCTGRGQGQQSQTATVCGRAVSSQDGHYPPLRPEASSRLYGETWENHSGTQSPGTGAGSGRVRQPIRRGDGERHGGSDGTGQTRHGDHTPRRDRGRSGEHSRRSRSIGNLGDHRVAAHGILKRFDHCHGRRFTGLNQHLILLLRHGKKGRLQLDRNAH